MTKVEIERDGQIYKIEIGHSIQENSVGIEENLEGRQTLLEILREQKLFIDAPCNGNGKCGRCKVQFLEGTPKPTEREKRLLTDEERDAGIRLACVTLLKDDCRIKLLTDSVGELKVLANERERLMNQGEDPRSISAVNPMTRTTPASYTAGGIVNNIAPACGIAFDIGTTTLAAELVELATGNTLAVTTAVNHQRAYGADVISRIQASNGGKGAALQKSIETDLRQMTQELLRKADIPAQEVKKIVIAGNTTMCHLLLGFSCERLGVSPFTPVDISMMKRWKANREVTILPGISTFVGADITAGIYASGMMETEETVLLLDIGTNGEMVIGNKDGFLATSAAAGPVFEGGNISCGVPGVPGAVSHVSIARMGEMHSRILGENKDKSPEFWNEIRVDGITYSCGIETIEQKPPIGFCGTGIIDMVSELVREKLIDENGTLQEPWFERGFPLNATAMLENNAADLPVENVAADSTAENNVADSMPENVAADSTAENVAVDSPTENVAADSMQKDVATDSPSEKYSAHSDIPDIRFTQQDIREIQMGKSAIRAGIETLIEEYGKMPDKVYLAGGFGFYMDVERAVRIGLLPEHLKDRVTAPGNTSLAGAKRFLCEREKNGQVEEKMQWIAAHTKEINLAMHPKFNDLYLKYMFFE